MAWTTPKTWVTQDPLNATVMNTHLRDNLNALRAQTEDVQPKVTQMYPIFTGALVHRAVHSMTTQRSYSSAALAQVHSSLSLTFTALSDEVLFSVQFAVDLDAGQQYNFGIWKDSASYSLALDGGGTTAVVASYKGHSGASVDAVWVNYAAPVSVSRGQSVTLYPTWGGTGTLQTSPTSHSSAPMILIAQEIGAFA